MTKNMPKSKYAGWNINLACLGKDGYTDKATVCTMGVLKPANKNFGFLFHLLPDTLSFKKSREELLKKIEAFYRIGKGRAPEGILVGGCSTHDRSKTQYLNLLELFRENKIKFSAFLGQKPRHDGFYEANGFSALTFFARDKKYVIQSTLHDNEVRTRAQMFEHFDIIQLAKQDQLIFENSKLALTECMKTNQV